jgi:hypothetical protein
VAFKLTNAEKCKAVVGPGRLSFLNVFKPSPKFGTEKTPDPIYEYSTTLWLPKEPNKYVSAEVLADNIKGIKELMKAAAEAKWGTKRPAKLAVPMKDGDTEVNGRGELVAPGHYYFRAKSGAEFKPKLVNGNNAPVHDGWESGDWANVAITAKAYEHAGKSGITFYLSGVQFLYVDEHFGSNDADEFDTVDGAHVPKSEDHDPFAD